MEKFNYEKAVNRLEEIAQKLENSELSLEEMMKLYEEGTSLAAKCSKALDEAELKITSFSLKGEQGDD